MAASYEKLWKLPIERNLFKRDLYEIAGFSSATLAKLSRSENANTKTLAKICKALDCIISEIMEFEDQQTKKRGGRS